jgi:hypothetical protein
MGLKPPRKEKQSGLLGPVSAGTVSGANPPLEGGPPRDRPHTAFSLGSPLYTGILVVQSLKVHFC